MNNTVVSKKQQTGFRADRELLNRFRSKLALEGRDMGEAIEGFISSYVSGAAASEVSIPPEEAADLEIIQAVLRDGGEAAIGLKQLARTFYKLKKQGVSDIGRNEPGPNSTDRARSVVTPARIEEAERVAAELGEQTRETRKAAPDDTEDGNRPSTAKNANGRRRLTGQPARRSRRSTKSSKGMGRVRKKP